MIVAAPVKFEPRDFILHLFAELCQKALGRGEVESIRRSRASLRRLVSILLRTVPPLVIVAGALLAFISVVPARWHIKPGLVWGSALVMAGLAAFLLAMRARTEYPFAERGVRMDTPPLDDEERRDRVLELAGSRLTDIWFQQSFTSGWSGQLSTAVEVEIEESHDLAKEPMSMPEIVSELRRLVKEISGLRTVRIGIDELDKIESPEAAWSFMNEIKVLFLIPNCFFLVSVSEDAMSMFERRGLPFRDVFDSSFDDVVSVGYLDASGAIDLIERRIIGMRVPFILLCHCMAAGLARDLIRSARDVITLNAGSSSHGLSDICRQMVDRDVAAKAEATIVACRRLAPTVMTQQLLLWLDDAKRRNWTSDSLLAWVEGAESHLTAIRVSSGRRSGSYAQRKKADALAIEFATFCFFSVSLLAFFVTERPRVEFRDAARSDGDSYPISDLVRARQNFAVDPLIAWNSINQFRVRIGLRTIPFPDPGDGPDADSKKLSDFAVGLFERLQINDGGN